MSEEIKHAAMRSVNGMIFLGKSHADCFHQATNIGIEVSKRQQDQGFMTSLGHYLDRVEAAKLAVERKQVPPRVVILFSEDLWCPKYEGKFKYDYVRGYYEGE